MSTDAARIVAPEARGRIAPEARGRIAVIIPTFNEAASIEQVVAELPRDLVREVIVADGGSTDGTQERARAAGARVLDAGRGYGRACRLGAEAADRRCDVLCWMDGDAADRGDLLGRLASPVLEGAADFSIASRTRGAREPGAMSWHQVFAGEVVGLGMFLLYRVRYTDMCAYRVLRRDLLPRLGMREATYGWNLEMQMRAAKLGLRVAEVPMPYRCRAGGASKVAGNLRNTVKAGSRIAAVFAREFMRELGKP